MADTPDTPEALISRFIFERLLNQDSQGRRIILVGRIDSQPALLLAERAAFSASPSHLNAFISSLRRVRNLGDNDIYRWYLASASSAAEPPESQDPSSKDDDSPARDLKLNLIYPCTPKHIAKYTPQATRYVVETPAIYARHVRPYILGQLSESRLTWVYNILDGRTEAEDVLYRSWEHASSGAGPSAGEVEDATATAADDDDDRFLLLPDLNWDRTTLSALHLLALPLRRDKHSLRDLTPRDAPWLRGMMARIHGALGTLYGGQGLGDVKMYLHYQPTYYHLHVHVVAAGLEAGATQAVGKAVDLGFVVGLLELGVGMESVELGYSVGEGGELWEKVWKPQRAGEGEEEAQPRRVES